MRKKMCFITFWALKYIEILLKFLEIMQTYKILNLKNNAWFNINIYDYYFLNLMFCICALVTKTSVIFRSMYRL
jgi:hypothetical protein